MKKFDAIVLSGGGTRGFGTLGTLHYYYECGKYNHNCVKTYAGTSIGSAISLLLTCGYLPMEIFKDLYLMSTFFEPDNKNKSLVDTFKDIFKEMGLLSIDSFISKIEVMIKSKLNIDYIPTLRELYYLTGKKFLSVSTNITKMRSEYIDYNSFPELKCTDAVKLSCNIPLLFKNIKYKDSYYIDGAFVNNFPVDQVYNDHENILSILLPHNKPYTEENIPGYLGHILMTMLTEILHIRLDGKDEKITLVTLDGCKPDSNSPIPEPTVSRDSRMKMFLRGYNIGKIKDSEEYLFVKDFVL